MEIGTYIKEIKARQILTSRGIPTVEIDLITTLGTIRSSCPSGASTGSKEAIVITDNKESYSGKSVIELIKKAEIELFPKILKMPELEQSKIDEFLKNYKNRLGANIILPLSLCFARLIAKVRGISLCKYIARLSQSELKMPIPCFNVINGGKHSGNLLQFQEIMVVFFYENYQKNLEMAVLFYKNLKELIAKKFTESATSVGDEGGFAPPISTLEEGLDLIMETYKEKKFGRMKIAIDAAASEFFVPDNTKSGSGIYDLGTKKLTSNQFVNYYQELLANYPLIFSLEDPFHEEDYEAWRQLTSKVDIRVIGDDLTVTNKERVTMAVDKKLCNGLLVKLNQIGTLSETLESCYIAKANEWVLMVSHRSGETEDTFISDFSVGIGAMYIKAGAPCRGERVCKYNELLRINEEHFD